MADIPDAEVLSAEAAVLIDAQTGQVLYEKNAYESRQPASITKILTGMLALEHLNADSVLTASAAAVDIPSWGTSAYIEAGERLTVEQAMYAMMLKSANDAANVLGEEIAGSLTGFANLMNERAAELGALDTHFTNANGLPERSHYTTAYDMALITRQAIATPGFLTYFGADTYTMPATNRSGGRVFTNTHRMLLPGYEQYSSEVLGGKTGYTVPAGYTLVTAARRAGRTLIAVVLKSDSYYADTRALLDFGFEEFTSYPYAFEEGTAAEAPIWDGEREAGRVYFQQPESVTLLLHHSVDPDDIRLEYLCPDRLEQGEDIAGSAVLSVAGSGPAGLPDTLLTLPLPIEVATLEPPVPEDHRQQSSAQPDWLTAPVPAYLSAALLIFFAAGLLALWYLRRARRYAARRLRNRRSRNSRFGRRAA